MKEIAKLTLVCPYELQLIVYWRYVESRYQFIFRNVVLQIPMTSKIYTVTINALSKYPNSFSVTTMGRLNVNVTSFGTRVGKRNTHQNQGRWAPRKHACSKMAPGAYTWALLGDANTRDLSPLGRNSFSPLFQVTHQTPHSLPSPFLVVPKPSLIWELSTECSKSKENLLKHRRLRGRGERSQSTLKLTVSLMLKNAPRNKSGSGRLGEKRKKINISEDLD